MRSRTMIFYETSGKCLKPKLAAGYTMYDVYADGNRYMCKITAPHSFIHLHCIMCMHPSEALCFWDVFLLTHDISGSLDNCYLQHRCALNVAWSTKPMQALYHVGRRYPRP